MIRRLVGRALLWFTDPVTTARDTEGLAATLVISGRSVDEAAAAFPGVSLRHLEHRASQRRPQTDLPVGPASSLHQQIVRRTP